MSEELLVTPQEIIDRASGPVISVDEMARLSGGTIAKKTFFNLFNTDDTMPQRLKVGRRTCVRADGYARWFCGRVHKA